MFIGIYDDEIISSDLILNYFNEEKKEHSIKSLLKLQLQLRWMKRHNVLDKTMREEEIVIFKKFKEISKHLIL